MYKLFLAFRYLRKLLMAYFAMLCVALCVAMMLIVISVMNGFLGKIESAAKGLYGDIIIDSPGLAGLKHYDAFIDKIERDVPEVHSASPFILSYGILEIPGTDHRQPVQIAGIRLPERAETSDFEEGLFVQKGFENPSFDPDIEHIIDVMMKEIRRTADTLERIIGDNPENLPPEKMAIASRIADAVNRQESAIRTLRRAEPYQEKLAELDEKIERIQKESGDTESLQADQIREQILDTRAEAGFTAPDNRVILGLGLPALSFRTELGKTIRVVGPGDQIAITIIPLGRRMSMADVSPNKALLSVVDDCSTDVASIDSNIVYVPFRTLQRLNNMTAEYSPDDPTKVVVPARTGQIHVKVEPKYASDRRLIEVRDKIDAAWQEFRSEYPDAGSATSIQTWRQHQAKFIGPIEQQRTLTVIMFGIISMVSVVLIFVIFYMIVHQKTFDIGVLKSVGASSPGVAWIFLIYGAGIGLVGAIVGSIGGYYFVRYINEIQDFIDDTFGFRVWSRDVFMFEKIPNQVDPATVGMIVVGAIVAGLIGAAIPSIRAARMQPVEALRYE